VNRLTIVLIALSPVMLLACQLANIALSPTATAVPRPMRTPTPIEAQAVPRSSPTEPSPPSAPPAVTVIATTKENLRVRAAPSVTGQIVAQLKKGEMVQVLGRTNGSDWWQIALPIDPSARGWIAASFTILSGPVDSIPVLPRNEPTSSVSPAGPAVPAASAGATENPTPALKKNLTPVPYHHPYPSPYP
jgi:hypothetical protein